MDNLEILRKSSRRSAWLTIYGVVIIITSLAYSYIKLADLENNIIEKKKELKGFETSVDHLKSESNDYKIKLIESKNELMNLRKTQDSVLNFLVSVTDENKVHILDSSVDWNEVKNQLSNLPAGDRKNAILNSILLAWKDIPFTMGKEGVRAGFDSPRFVRYVLETVGLKVENEKGKRLSDTLMGAFEKVKKPSPGDLVFFKGQVGSFGFILLSVGESDSEHVGVGTLQRISPLQIISMDNINTPHFPLKGYFRVIYPDEKSPNK